MTKNSTGINALSFAPGNAQAVGQREDQQDSFGFSDPTDQIFFRHGGLLAVLADGMGGLAHGAFASQTAVGTFLNSYGAKVPEEAIPQALDRSLSAADTAVFDFAASFGIKGDVGATVVAAAFTPAGLHWTSVGDSALYLCRDGKLRRLNRVHTLAVHLAQLVQSGELSAEQARDDPDRDALTSYVGAGGLPEVDSSTEPLELMRGDVVILCSDGLYRALGPEEIARLITPPAEAQQTAEVLLAAALARALPNQDNVTILCVKVTDPGYHPQ